MQFSGSQTSAREADFLPQELRGQQFPFQQRWICIGIVLFKHLRATPGPLLAMEAQVIDNDASV